MNVRRYPSLYPVVLGGDHSLIFPPFSYSATFFEAVQRRVIENVNIQRISYTLGEQYLQQLQYNGNPQGWCKKISSIAIAARKISAQLDYIDYLHSSLYISAVRSIRKSVANGYIFANQAQRLIEKLRQCIHSELEVAKIITANDFWSNS